MQRTISAVVVMGAIAWIGGSWPVQAQLQKRVGPVEKRKAVVPADVARPRVPFRDPVVIQLPLPAGTDRNLQALTNQYLRQFRPILRDEYLFARQVCRLTEEERKEIALDGERALRKVVDDYATMARTRRASPSAGLLSPRKGIQEGLADALRRRLPDTRWECYRREVELRQADFKRAMARFCVAQFDRELILTEGQREEIMQVLNSSSDPSWSMMLDSYPNYQGVLPPVPANSLEPILTAAQNMVLRGLLPSRVVRPIVVQNRQFQVQQLQAIQAANGLNLRILGAEPLLAEDLAEADELTEAETTETNSRK
jgi:hypothetical protein